MPKIDWDKVDDYEPPMVEIHPFEERTRTKDYVDESGLIVDDSYFFPTIMYTRAASDENREWPTASRETLEKLRGSLSEERETEFREWLRAADEYQYRIDQGSYILTATFSGALVGFVVNLPKTDPPINEVDTEASKLFDAWRDWKYPDSSHDEVDATIRAGLNSVKFALTAITLDAETPFIPTQEELYQDFIDSEFSNFACAIWAEETGAPEWLKLNGINEPAEELEQLFKQDAARLHRHTIPVTKVSQELTTFKPNRKNSVNVGTVKNPIGVSISFEYEGEGLSLKRHLSEYDQAISDAWLALWYEGARVVTDRQIFQAMTGTTSKVTEKQVQTVRESMDKCRDTDTIIDFSAEVRGREIQDGDTRITTETAYREGKLINADVVTAIGKNGEKVRAYVANGEPILGWYARVTGKLPTIPQRLLTETAGAVSLTPNNIALRSYLLRRIESMKRNPKLSKSIKYDTMQQRVYGGEQSATERTRNKSAALKLLTALKEAGHIADATEYYRNENGHRRTVGVKIELTDKEQKKPSSRKRH